MMETALLALTEDELNTLVSIAIRRAEVSDDVNSPTASDACLEVMVYEELIDSITRPEEITGGIARVGAVRAALAAGQRLEAARLASLYLAEEALPLERRVAMERAFERDREHRARRFSALARTGRLAELDEWRATASRHPRVFPVAA